MKKVYSVLLPAMVVMLSLFCNKAQAYTTEYNSVTYYSPYPYNLNIYYFKAADVPLDPTYQVRVSDMANWMQSHYGLWMYNMGYGFKTFGLWCEQAHPENVRIIIINGAHNLDYYRTNASNPNGNGYLIAEVNAFRAANPSYETSAHRLVLTAAPNLTPGAAGLPFYGNGRAAYAVDFPLLDLQYYNQPDTQVGRDFNLYFGGMAHELGHGMNLPHSHQTASENANPMRGTNLMADGNQTLTISPTFLNRAGCAILNNCQLFSPDINTGFYTGHVGALTTLHGSYNNGDLTIYGNYVCDRSVVAINIYHDPGASPSAGYNRVAFSGLPSGNNNFSMTMDVDQVLFDENERPSSGNYNLEVELVLGNGETIMQAFPFQYVNRVPVFNFNFGDDNCYSNNGGWQLEDIGEDPFSPGTSCYHLPTNSFGIRSWGNTLSQPTDKITFVYKPLTGNGTITTRMVSVTNQLNFSSGLMLRNTLDAGSKFFSIDALDTRGIINMWRLIDNVGVGTDTATPYPFPVWLRIDRNGNTVESYYGSDGVNWTFFRTLTLDLPGTVYVGLMSAGGGARGSFDSLTLYNELLGTDTTEANTTGITVYPVPSDGHVTIAANNISGKATLRLYNIVGALILEKSISDVALQHVIDISSLAPGIYQLRLDTENGTIVKKIQRL